MSTPLYGGRPSFPGFQGDPADDVPFQLDNDQEAVRQAFARRGLQPGDIRSMPPEVLQRIAAMADEQQTAPRYAPESNSGGLLGMFDAPRRATWNLIRGLSDAIGGGNADMGDILPGLAGLAGGGILAATGLGPLAAILGGSAGGGLMQMLGGNEAMNPGEFIAKHGGPDEGSLGNTLGGAILGGLTDPTIAATPFLPGRLGALGRAGDRATTGLYNARMARNLPSLSEGLAESRLGGFANEAHGMGVAPLTYGTQDAANAWGTAARAAPHPDELNAMQQMMQTGRIGGLDDLDRLQQAAQSVGQLPKTFEPATQLANRQQIMQQMQQPAISDALSQMSKEGTRPDILFPAGRGNAGKSPQVSLDALLNNPDVGHYVPMQQEQIMAALQQNPELIKELVAQAAVEPGGFKGAGTRAKYLQQALSEAMAQGSQGQFAGLYSKMHPQPGM